MINLQKSLIKIHIKFLKSKQVLAKIKYQYIINIIIPKDLYEVHE